MSEYSNILSLSDNHNILGNNNETLQFLLRTEDSIITKKQYIAYCSKNLDEYNYDLINKNNILKQNELKDKGKLIMDDNLIYIKNKQMNFEYIGLFNIGKLIKIIPSLYKDLIINYEKCITFTKNIDLLEKDEITKKIKPYLNQKFFKAKNRFCYVYSMDLAIDKILASDILNKRDFLFLSTSSN